MANHSNWSDDKIVHVSAFPIIGKELVVQTTHGEIMKGIKSCKLNSKELLKQMSNKIYREVIDENMDTLATLIKAKNEQAIKRWGEICTDVVILYCIRFVLHNKEIPISENHTRLPCFTKSLKKAKL